MLQLALASLKQPNVSIVRFLQLGFARADLVRGAIALACLTAILDIARLALQPPMDPAPPVGEAMPFALAFSHFISIMVVAFVTEKLGRFFGGKGNFDGALKVSLMSSFIWLFALVVVLITWVIAPPMMQLMLFAALMWLLIVFTIFVKELHGFKSYFSTLAGVFASGLVLGMVLIMVLGALGVLEMGMPQNV